MQKELKVGIINTLRIDRYSPHGLYLEAENGDDVLLPQAYVTDDMLVDDPIDVFIYTDSEDRVVATTLTPLAKLGEFGYFEVVDVTKIGAFVDWGLPKDLFVPKHKMRSDFRVGQKYVLHVDLDERTNRLIGVERVTAYLKQGKSLKTNQEVDVLLFAKTPMGYKAIVNNRHEGMIFSNEIFEKIKIGMKTKAYVKNIRPDGKLDLTLRAKGAAQTEKTTNKILIMLEENRGSLPYNYKSDAEVIKKVFGMSKKEYKRTLTALINDNKIEVTDSGMYAK